MDTETPLIVRGITARCVSFPDEVSLPSKRTRGIGEMRGTAAISLEEIREKSTKHSEAPVSKRTDSSRADKKAEAKEPRRGTVRESWLGESTEETEDRISTGEKAETRVSTERRYPTEEEEGANCSADAVSFSILPRWA